jgi:hypothetical protein
VFLLDRYDNCWRWLSGREDSPWYPSLRIFRQTRPGEWPPVIARVAAALSEMSQTLASQPWLRARQAHQDGAGPSSCCST